LTEQNFIISVLKSYFFGKQQVKS